MFSQYFDNVRDWLDYAGLVINMHYRDQESVFSQCTPNFLGFNPSASCGGPYLLRKIPLYQ